MLYLLLLLLFKIIYKMWFRNMSSVHCTIWKYRICWNPLTSTWIECRVSVVELQSSPSLVVERAEELKCKIIFGGKWLVSRRASQNYLRHGCFLSSRNQPHYSRDGYTSKSDFGGGREFPFPVIPGNTSLKFPFPSIPVAFCNFPYHSRGKEVLAGN